MWLETKKARNFNAVVWVLGEVNGYVVIDDTLAPRCSVDAPGAAVRFDHAANARRSCCANASSRLAAVVPCRDRSVPLVSGLCRSLGNAGKLAMAKGLLRAVGDP